MSGDNPSDNSYRFINGRIVSVEQDNRRCDIRCLPAVEEALRRISANLMPHIEMNQINEEVNNHLRVVAIAETADTSDSTPETDNTENRTFEPMERDEDMIDPVFRPSSPSSSVDILHNVHMLNTNEGQRYCWVCFATDEDDKYASWVRPCHCRGTTKWVHQSCIQRWVDEKQKGHMEASVRCPQCNTEYIIVYPNMGPIVFILDTIDCAIVQVCPLIMAGIVVGSIYWTAVTYGAVTVMQVVGHKDAITLLEQADPLVLLVGLPTIPIVLVIGKMLDWEDQALKLLRRHACKLPILRHFLPRRFYNRHIMPESPISAPDSSAGRVLCSALFLPTIASICGKIFFDSVNSTFHRTLLGGFMYITIKGAFKMYYKQQHYVRLCQRRIMDYTDRNMAQYKRLRSFLSN